MRLLWLLAATMALVPLALTAYSDLPPPAHTGGFGEPTCAECHDDNPINADGGVLQLDGIPRSYTPGRSYAIRILLRRLDLERAGFQLASRFSKGPATGDQAGTWTVDGDLIQTTTDRDVVYVEQTKKGNLVKPTGAVEWQMSWQAPATSQGAIAFHVAANASNRDDSPLGDFIYVTSETSEPAVSNEASSRFGSLMPGLFMNCAINSTHSLRKPTPQAGKTRRRRVVSIQGRAGRRRSGTDSEEAASATFFVRPERPAPTVFSANGPNRSDRS